MEKELVVVEKPIEEPVVVAVASALVAAFPSMAFAADIGEGLQ